MPRLYLKPVEGLIIPDPATRQPLPAEGQWVEGSIYWSRRLNASEVTDNTEAQTAREAADAKKKDKPQ